MKLGPFGLRAGYRATYLNDQGRLDPEATSTGTSPYVGWRCSAERQAGGSA